MDAPKRTCPKCGSYQYTFRSRKQMEATQETGPQLETKFRCGECGHEFKERVDGVLKKGPRPE